MKNISLFVLMMFSIFSMAQTGNIKGVVMSNGFPIEGVNITIKGKNLFTKTDKTGTFILNNIPTGNQTITLSFTGFRTINENIVISENQNFEKNFELAEDLLSLEEVVISGTRSEVPVYRSPVIVSRLSSKMFEATQTLALSEGLNFTPGLRLETNCQNCGFTQVRMNGLEGAYSQILINSRPIFSALVGVYGLDMLPTSMIDRVEVTRGGGSALYGGNAIAGTINIITKDPTENTFEIGLNQSFIDFDSPDRTINVNGSIISDDYKKGISFYAYNRDRKPWDANEDGYSEMTKLKNTTFGFDAFWNTSDFSKIKFNLFNISEFRRGGNNFHLPAHQTDITEQLDHKILGGSLSFEQYSKDLRQKFSIYTSVQTAKRESYYGSGGRILEDGDELTENDILAINAYGNSDDLSIVGGVQYSYEFNDKFLLLSGAEYKSNDVNDEMPGYGRLIDQKVGTLGIYSQLEIKPTKKLTFLVGARYDNINIKAMNSLDIESFKDKKNLNVFVPRITAMYSITDELKARASFSQGYRAPQAFDEDLHIETVGGSVMFTRLDPNLKTEYSNSFNASLNYTNFIGSVQSNIVLEGFHTKLNDAFITSNPTELPSGIAVATKRNGSGATVTGANIESSFAFSRKVNFQLGATFQTAKYSEEEIIWLDDDDEDDFTATKNILRTPDVYGYYTFTYNPIQEFTISLSGIYTGKMDVGHVIEPDTERTIIKRTPNFFEQHIRLAYDFDIKDNCIQLNTGVQNIFNSYQKDFDRGPLRDADYIYGPTKPRTFFVGLRYSLK
ncbi:MAG: TonB-dependent receptor [Flavobacteriaceae bacterium]|nr:TonB-dependent receptor [Flavobacteriaceae bacterium]